ncbi:acyltransferase [uncultured Cohaesibacter sp.]|uniref:acyltransferase family protein n=1 Tax=uncultured Cohaesibacter sp. TaxID=1002546 RepID=UPI002931B39F|nr:acyltransferase [uncultured Cohaesibacter sp.]
MKSDRFDVLDSWRGICACMVALYHFRVVSHISDIGLINASYLFVDFFFVLSGFVIAANYQHRLADGFGAGRFLILRLGRIYPLHFAMMLPFLAIDAVKDGVGSQFWQALTTNVLLIHGFGVNLGLWLNFPSWSISTEFAAYLVFALIIPFAGRSILPWLVPIFAGPVILGKVSAFGMASTFDLGVIRCLEGFALGIICFRLREIFPGLTRRSSPVLDSFLEIVAIGGTALYLTVFWDQVRSYLLVVPFLFAVVVLVFARQAGVVSKLLSARPFLFVGTLSYSIYLVHALVRSVSRAAAKVFEHFAGVELFTMDYSQWWSEPGLILTFGGNLWLGDLSQLVMLGVTIVLAYFTYRYIEEPGRIWSRNLAKKKGPVIAQA